MGRKNETSRSDSAQPPVPATLSEVTELVFPGGFSIRDEANAIVAFAFRNGPLEDLHAGEHSELLENKSLSRITDEEMKVLMIAACKAVEKLLRMKADDPDKYFAEMVKYNLTYCRRWER